MTIDLDRYAQIALDGYTAEQLRPVLRQALEERAHLREENARLRRYARHRPGCPVGACDCGWGDGETEDIR